MERYYSEGTKMTPEVILDSEKKVFSISGSSRPENPMHFYKPIFDWITEYIENSNDKFIFQVKMNYFNTSSSKILLDLFELFERLAESKDIHVIWYHQSDDQEMQEAGEELLDLVEISHEIKVID
jgi:hypothetical protein